MSVNLTTGVIPFTELFERLMTLGKVDSFNNEDFAKGVINDAYTRALPSLDDWHPLVKESFLTMSAYYSTGTVSCTAGSTSLTGSGTTWTASMTALNGWKIKFAGVDNVYLFTYASATTATISPALEGSTDLTARAYTLFREEYALPSDFDRFLQNGSIYVISGGRVQEIVSEQARDVFREQYSADPQDPIRRSMLVGTDSNGYRKVRLNPPPRTAKVYPIDYIPKVPPMKEYTRGTVAITNGSTAVVGTDTLFTTNVVAGQYFRVDSIGQGDSSKWYVVDSVVSNTQLNLTAAYEDDTLAGEAYTVCSSPSLLPSEFHEFILYEAATVVVASSSDPNTKLMIAKRSEVLSRLKKMYRFRRTNTQIKVEDDGYRR